MCFSFLIFHFFLILTCVVSTFEVVRLGRFAMSYYRSPSFWVLALLFTALEVLANDWTFNLRRRQEESIQPFTGAVGGFAAPAVRPNPLNPLLHPELPLSCVHSSPLELTRYCRYHTRETLKDHIKSHPIHSPTSPPRRVEAVIRRRMSARMRRIMGVGLRLVNVRLRMVCWTSLATLFPM